MAVKLAHGLKGGKIVRIREVENGLSCGCLCPNPKCQARLVAVQGKQTSWHFRHYVENHGAQVEYECEGARETAIHLIAKDLLSEELEQTLPARILTIRRHNYDEIKHESKKFRDYTVQEQMVVVFDYMKNENECSDLVATDESFIKPDVIAIKGAMEIYFEVLVTHFVDNIKREKIKSLGRSCIEIDLRHVDRNLDLETLKLEVLDPKNRKWVCHRKDDFYLSHIKNLKKVKGNTIGLSWQKRRRKRLNSQKLNGSKRRKPEIRKTIRALRLTCTKSFYPGNEGLQRKEYRDLSMLRRSKTRDIPYLTNMILQLV